MTCDGRNLEVSTSGLGQFTCCAVSQAISTSTKTTTGWSPEMGWGRGAANRLGRVPPGRPEGCGEGFANIYDEAAEAIPECRNGSSPDASAVYPTVQDGLEGARFVTACAQSSARNSAWVKLECGFQPCGLNCWPRMKKTGLRRAGASTIDAAILGAQVWVVSQTSRC